MCDTNEAIYEMLKDVEYSIDLILERFENIKVADDFLSCNDNITMLDSISMRILAIGEAFGSYKTNDYRYKDKLKVKIASLNLYYDKICPKITLY